MKPELLDPSMTNPMGAIMSTTTQPKHTADTRPKEIKLYSHSPIFYWWPVWVVGYLMAFLTSLDDGRMTVVPAGTEVRSDQQVEVAPGQFEKRDVLMLPANQPAEALEQPHIHMAHNQFLGTLFFLTLLVVFVSSNVPLRGLWEWIGVLVIALTVTVISLYGWWGTLFNWFYLLKIQINLAGYVFISTWLFAIWVVTVFYFDTRTYIMISPGQIRVRQAIGQGEKVFDATLLSVHLQPNILFRHRVLGFFGAGDLIVRTGGPHADVFEWPNVLFVRSRLKEIEHLLQSREVLPERV